MPLMPCPECERPISDRAPACPHCGWPNPEVMSLAETQPSGEVSFLQSPAVHTVAKGLTALVVLNWVGKILFAVGALALLAYFFRLV